MKKEIIIITSAILTYQAGRYSHILFNKETGIKA